MERLILLLLLIAPISSALKNPVQVFVDSSLCIHLRCEWRGEGKYCNSATLLDRINQQKTVPGATPVDFIFRSRRKDESRSSILRHIQSEHPWNTFTVVNDDVVNENCKGWRLWCNADNMFLYDDYAEFLKSVEKHDAQPRTQC